jgi:BolA protein
VNTERIQLIESRLRAAMDVVGLEIEDQSHLHAGHAGAAAGGGHFRVRVVSPDFRDESPVRRHRRVYEAMGDAMRQDTIHALSIEALTPAEAESAG